VLGVTPARSSSGLPDRADSIGWCRHADGSLICRRRCLCRAGARLTACVAGEETDDGVTVIVGNRTREAGSYPPPAGSCRLSH
jgi:hypothetical protein